MRKKGFAGGMLAGILIAAAALCAGIIIRSIADRGVTTISEYSDAQILESVNSTKIDTLEELIDTYYLDEIDKDALAEGVYAGIVDGLGDPYSVYYTAEEYEELLEESSGEYCGIGVTVIQDTSTGIITVLEVSEGSPAEEAGIAEDDVITAVGGNDASGEELADVVAQIKGDEGTTVTITVLRDGEYIDFEVERRVIEVVSVEGQMLDDDVGYIAISQFEENTYDQFVRAYEELLAEGMEAVIFDLRDNPGGLYSSVCDVLDYILPEGTLVYTEDKYGVIETQSSAASCIDIPMAVLINENSASAAEIFAGAVQDFEAGAIVGTTSYGKGIVQSIFPLSDGSAVKLTVSYYFTPDGNCIHGIGIEPDVEVELEQTQEDDADAGEGDADAGQAETGADDGDEDDTVTIDSQIEAAMETLK